ncbi:BMC domain-containing protein [Clostridium sp. SYSU_GA19001]|uniref:BMC domain-containing protein n=1 Tax=Clostridium caldaquaticum TaxID=2940653 RepID=UPI002077329F|nr:BMC domain-containing protein [Clostridium caldaquaticum]MCM8710018.1 BMC domain-containing protein [Clostridium caldaquaticum]
MDKAIGMIEYKTVASGITATDKMVKTAEVEILQAQTVCPGKYIVLLSGKLSAVKAAIESGKADFEENVIDSFILGNPHPSIFRGINGTAVIEETEALGILETYSAASIIVASDICAKTAVTEIVEIRIAKGMCGKSYLLITGELAAVNEAIEAAYKNAKESGMILDKSVIPNPDKKLWEKIL